MKKKIKVIWLISLFFLSSCSSKKEASYLNYEKEYKLYDETYSNDNFTFKKVEKINSRDDFIKGFDASLVESLEQKGSAYYDYSKQKTDIFKLLKSLDYNTIRLRLFNDPNSSKAPLYNGNLNIDRIISLSKRAKKNNLKILLDLHYSDSWADPKNQACPYSWENKTFQEVNGLMYEYTRNVILRFKNENIDIDYVQIGNEIDNGICFPYGQISWDNKESEKETLDSLVTLLSSGVKAFREESKQTKIIIHQAMGLKSYNNVPTQAIWFFDELISRNLDFDIIGSSYYTFESNSKVNQLTTLINQITSHFSKPFLMCENSYAYTLKDNPNGNNLFNENMKDSSYEVSIQGQVSLMSDCIEQILNVNSNMGTGYVYWGGEWISGVGVSGNNNLTNGNYLNQALFTYEGLPLPSLGIFKYIK